MYRMYYIKSNYKFRTFSLAIFRLINEKKGGNQFTSYLPTVYNPHNSSIAAY